jgi:hypothetical protein
MFIVRLNHAILPRDSERRCLPSDVSAMVAAMRNDIFVIDGGIARCRVPFIFILMSVFYLAGQRLGENPLWPARDGSTRATK